MFSRCRGTKICIQSELIFKFAGPKGLYFQKSAFLGQHFQLLGQHFLGNITKFCLIVISPSMTHTKTKKLTSLGMLFSFFKVKCKFVHSAVPCYSAVHTPVVFFLLQQFCHNVQFSQNLPQNMVFVAYLKIVQYYFCCFQFTVQLPLIRVYNIIYFIVCLSINENNSFYRSHTEKRRS